MAENNQSRADELFRILKDIPAEAENTENAKPEENIDDDVKIFDGDVKIFDGKEEKNDINAEDDVVIPILADMEDDDDDYAGFVTDVSEKNHTIKVDDLVGALAAKENPEEEVKPITPEEMAEAEIPDTIFNHLTNEGEDHVSPEISSHFTEATGKEPKIVEETEDEDGEEKEGKLKKAGGILSKLSAIPKAIIYILIVAIISAYLSYFIITIGNDVFALVSDKGTVVVTIPEDATDDDVAAILEENGVIEYGWVYKLYMKYRGSGDEQSKYISGDRTLKYEYNYSQIITALTSSAVDRKVVRLTIPEGFTVDQMIELFVKNGIGTKEGFKEAINEYPFKHEFVQALDEAGYPETRIYRLEGYLYPDTYDFYTDSSEVAVINKMLNAFNDKFYKDFVKENGDGETYQKTMLDKYGLTLDQLVTLASMVQSEGLDATDFEYISYVFHNRLSHSKTFPKLESDATIQYVLPEREKDSSNIDISYESPYNTYLYEGLPPGAISNPGYDALSATMFPSAPLNKNGKEINAYFFVSNNAGKTYYAATASAHENNVVQVKKDNKAIEEGTYEG